MVDSGYGTMAFSVPGAAITTMVLATLPTPIHQIQFPHFHSQYPPSECSRHGRLPSPPRVPLLSGRVWCFHPWGHNISVWAAIHRCPQRAGAWCGDGAGFSCFYKLDFATFDDSKDSLNWLNRCERFFGS